MLRQIRLFMDNDCVKVAGVSSLLLNLFADAMGSGIFYWIVFSFIAVLFVVGMVSEIRKDRKISNEVVHIPIVIKVDDGPEPRYVMKNLSELPNR